jgi:hypothetical protein
LCSSVCVFRTDVSLRMAYPRSKRVALLDTKTLLSKYSCVVTDTSSVYYTILTQWDVTCKGIQSVQLYGRIVNKEKN